MNSTAGMIRKYLGIAVVFFMSVVSENAQAAPSSGALQFQYGGRAGFLRITHTLDRASSRECTLTLRGVVSYEGSATVEALRSLATVKIPKTRRVTSLSVFNLPAVTSNEAGDPAVLSLQARVTCGQSAIISNAFARYVKCGRTGVVNPKKFLRLIQLGIKTSRPNAGAPGRVATRSVGACPFS